jgi:diguanylate cyclase (GGDEF)-like protein/PAS domain S-box-containing protein
VIVKLENKRSSDNAKASLLIVDDNEININLISRCLQKHEGYTLTTAGGGKQALDLIRRQPFDVVLLDLKMPEVSGHDVLMVVRQTYSLSQLPIIIISAEEDSKAAVDTLQLGANDYVVKPIDFKTLKARIDTQVNLKHNEQAYMEIKDNLEQLVAQRTDELDDINEILRKERQRFEYLLTSSPTITYATSVDSKHHCNFVSNNVTEILGYLPEEMTNDSEFWLNHIRSEDKEKIFRKLSRNLKKGRGVIEYLFLHKDGSYRWVRDMHRVLYAGERPVEIVGSWTDITEQQQLKDEINYKQSHDELTGLINRKEFERRLQHILEGSMSDTGQHIVCYLDLDQFKVINDTQGRTAGDEILRQLSEIFKDTLSHRDVLAYLGGDEFGILLQHCALNQANRALSILQDAIREFRLVWNGNNLAITASIGVVPVDKNTGGTSSILSIAEAACNAAKQDGRDRIYNYTVTDESFGNRQQEMLWVERINRALEEDRFYLYYQPIVALKEALHDTHYELLIRMKDDNGDLVPPGAFLPAAERYNLSSKIDRWVIQTFLSWFEAYSELLEQNNSWGINLSGHSLSDENLLQFVIEELNHKQIPANKIYFEITETAAIGNLNNATQFIDTLKKHGCRFALDDFGSGLSSFSYLRNLHVDFLKIDGMFVKEMVNNSTDFAMVKAINDVGQVMGKKTIAEFVENNEIVQKLKEIGVDYAQGYGICKPKPLTEYSISKNPATS